MTTLPVLQKPPYGESCNGCGECCKASTCELGMAVFEQNDGPCPGLEVEDGLYRCGLLLHPHRYAGLQAEIHGEGALKAAAALLIGTGIGCDCEMDGEPDNPRYRNFLREASSKILPLALQSIFVWVNKGGEGG